MPTLLTGTVITAFLTFFESFVTIKTTCFQEFLDGNTLTAIRHHFSFILEGVKDVILTQIRQTLL